MLPVVEYKLHPKMMEIQEEKRKRREELSRAYEKQAVDLSKLKEDRRQYMDTNKQVIQDRKEEIHQKKVAQTHKIIQQEQQRQLRIHEKRLERLQKLVPERRALIQQLRDNYRQEAEQRHLRKEQRWSDFEKEQAELMNKLLKPQMPVQDFLNINDGICAICLTEKAQLMMKECKHLVACTNCEFIMRMQVKCPLCRQPGSYMSIYARKKKVF